MSCPDLGMFWGQNKQRIGEALPHGIDELAKVFQSGADAFELCQTVEGPYIHWQTPEGQHAVTFAVVPDPRDLNAVLDVYVQAKQRQPALMAVFVHQWSDGEDNWDAFVITPQRAMQHADRISGSDTVLERGPALREDLYTLFACDRNFPEPGREEWAELLAGPVEGIRDQLGRLADNHGCTQVLRDDVVQWVNAEGRIEAQFFVLPDPKGIDAFICMYG
jgi:hypothetical protein